MVRDAGFVRCQRRNLYNGGFVNALKRGDEGAQLRWHWAGARVNGPDCKFLRQRRVKVYFDNLAKR